VTERADRVAVKLCHKTTMRTLLTNFCLIGKSN
jgi:hypothetical protein